MASTPEGKVKNLVKLALKSLNCWAYWPVTVGYAYAGCPDVIFLYKGKFFACEVKAPGRRKQEDRGCSKLQVKQMREIEKSGGKCFVVDCKEEIEDMMKEVLDASH